MATTKPIAGGLSLHALRDEQDRKRFAAFNGECNNPQEEITCDCLVHHHPHTWLDDYWLIEDERGERPVSCTCLLPWNAKMRGIDLKIAQLEMVLTRREYRGRGLVRAQVENFHVAARERGYDLSIIAGISYFYRQFGYAYAIDMEPTEALPAALVPGALPAGLEAARLRPARPEDIPRLVALYAHGAAGLDFYLTRGAAYWEYLLVHARQPVEILEDGGGRALGYAIGHRRGERVRLPEHAITSVPAAYALLALLRAEGTSLIEAVGPHDSPLARAARSLGSHAQAGGQWLVRITDPAAFLVKIRPLLEARLAASALAGWSGALVINLYKEAFRLTFAGGRLQGVEPLGFRDYSMGADGGDAGLPPEAFTRLVTGFRTLDQLHDAWPDIDTRPQARLLLEALFPPMESFLNAPYHVYH